MSVPLRNVKDETVANNENNRARKYGVTATSSTTEGRREEQSRCEGRKRQWVHLYGERGTLRGKRKPHRWVVGKGRRHSWRLFTNCIQSSSPLPFLASNCMNLFSSSSPVIRFHTDFTLSKTSSSSARLEESGGSVMMLSWVFGAEDDRANVCWYRMLQSTFGSGFSPTPASRDATALSRRGKPCSCGRATDA